MINYVNTLVCMTDNKCIQVYMLEVDYNRIMSAMRVPSFITVVANTGDREQILINVDNITSITHCSTEKFVLHSQY